MNLRMDATTILMSIVGTLAIDKKPANGVLVSLDLNSREVVALAPYKAAQKPVIAVILAPIQGMSTVKIRAK